MLGFRRLAPGAFASAGNRHAPAAGQGGKRSEPGAPEEETGSMSQTPKRWSIKGAVFAASLAVVFAACGTTASSPSASAPASTAPSVAPSASAAAYDGMVYPESGTSACGTTGYSGQVGLIKAIDAKTVEFTLCAPDAA